MTPQQAIQETAARLAAFKAHKVPISPTGDDARQLINDMIAIAELVDPIFEALGKTAADNFNLKNVGEWSGFISDLVREADLPWSLETVATQLDNDIDSQRTDPCGWAKANLMGVD